MLKFFILLLSIASVRAAESSLFGGQEKGIVINNRVLGVVNGKPLTVMDILKKMDVIFYKQYPEYRNNTMAKAQFYQASWKATLKQLIDKELIVADAEEAKMEVSHGDIRQEMESLFGPNVLDNLDRIGLSFDEAWQIIKDDIILKRMMYFRVHMKAIKHVTPLVIQEAYQLFKEKNIRKDEWRYQILTIRDSTSELSEQCAKEAYAHLKEGASLKEIANDKIALSEEYVASVDELSDETKSLITKLHPGEFTEPVLQKSRKSNDTFYRIFVLNTMREAGAPPLAEVESALANHLIEEMVAKETDQYIKRLHSHFGYKEDVLKELIPENFQPIAIQ